MPRERTKRRAAWTPMSVAPTSHSAPSRTGSATSIQRWQGLPLGSWVTPRRERTSLRRASPVSSSGLIASPPKNTRAFLFRVAVNLGRSQLRRRKRLAFVRLAAASKAGATTVPDPSAAVDDRLLIRSALSVLTPRQRECAILVDYVGLDAISVGRILKLKPSTVHVHLARARSRLASQLSGARKQD